MSTVTAIAVKDLRLMSRDWLGMFFILGLPILMAIFFGSMYGSVDSGSAKLRIAIVNEDNSPASRQFVVNLQETGNVDVETLNRKSALDRVRRGQLTGMIVLPKKFGETAGIPWLPSPAIEIGVDPSRQAEEGMLEGLVMQAAGKLMMEKFENPAAMRPFVAQSRRELADAKDVPPLQKAVLLNMMDSLDEFMALWQRVAATEKEPDSAETGKGNAKSVKGDAAGGFQLARIEPIDVTQQHEKDSPAALVKKLRSKWDVSFPQAMIWGILACAAGFAISIVRERKQGTFLRLQIAPVSRVQILAGKGLACFLAVLAVVGVMIAIGSWLGMRPENYAFLALAAVCIAWCFVGIMMLMSVLGKSEEAVSGAAWSANMLMAMFGGGMIPLVFMPPFMKTLSNLSPAKWSVLALEGAIWRGFTLTEMALPCAILVAVGAICMTAGGVLLSRAAD
jgi:ABC-2 type transport system permease protein